MTRSASKTMPAPGRALVQWYPMPLNWLRLAYAFEFLLALIAILSLWSQVGGQGHLDLMPWYTKLALTVGLGVAVVAGTAAAVAGERAWNAKTAAYLLLGLSLAAVMGAVTYYYHVHENDEDGTSAGDSGVATSLWVSPPALPNPLLTGQAR
jgi:heme/copper-type cytochrome/quinol oxidase subunit 3